MIYLQTILQRTEGKLIRRVYEEMKADPGKDDWCELVANDLKEVGITLRHSLRLNAEVMARA